VSAERDARDVWKKAMRKRERERYARQYEEKHKNEPKQGEVGFFFTVRQSGGSSHRRYWVCFTVDAGFKAQWSGGVKPNANTLARVNAIDWSKAYLHDQEKPKVKRERLPVRRERL
jgi:hypothetical protein